MSKKLYSFNERDKGRIAKTVREAEKEARRKPKPPLPRRPDTQRFWVRLSEEGALPGTYKWTKVYRAGDEWLDWPGPIDSGPDATVWDPNGTAGHPVGLLPEDGGAVVLVEFAGFEVGVVPRRPVYIIIDGPGLPEGQYMGMVYQNLTDNSAGFKFVTATALLPEDY